MWEGRFKSQPLLDEAAVLTAMSYVDLNPIRAKMARIPEDSDYTSIQQRIKQSLNSQHSLPIPLVELTQSKQRHKNAIQFNQEDYLALVDWLGRAILPNKKGYIAEQIPPVLERLNLQSDEFIQLMQRKDDLSGLTAIGSPAMLTHYFEKLGSKRVVGKALSQKLFT